MKSFFAGPATPWAEPPAFDAEQTADADTISVVPSVTGARIAVYDSLSAAPRVEQIDAADLAEAIERIASRAYNIARERGGAIPYTVVREVAENLIHADFREVVVTIMDGGNTIRFADQGPGIHDKQRAFMPGFTTATADMKRFIRGVGSGLPIVREYLGFSNGAIEIEDNLGHGAVVTLRVDPPAVLLEAEAPPEPFAGRRLSGRQKQVFSLVMELGSAGPSSIRRELSVGLSTAYRDLAVLEEAGLIEADAAGQRSLTELGVTMLDSILG